MDHGAGDPCRRRLGAPALSTDAREPLVAATAERLREKILAAEPEALIGSLPELTKALGVGTATLQQAARVLEHEGLLAVRRGPGGGYFGKRPDAAALERAVAAYLRVRASDGYEALETMTLLDCEIMPAAAACRDPARLAEMTALRERIDACASSEQRIAFEDDLHGVLFRMIDRPLMELLAGVAMRFYRSRPIPLIFEGEAGVAAWRRWRHHLIEAILAGDVERARFEADRHRGHLLRMIARERGG